MNKQTLNKLCDLIDYLESHNKNYTKIQYYNILDIQEILHKEKNKVYNTKKYLINYIYNDDDFKTYFKNNNDDIKLLKCFNNDFESAFYYVCKYTIDFIYNTCKTCLYLDKRYLDISYLIINNKIISLDFIFDTFKNLIEEGILYDN